MAASTMLLLNFILTITTTFENGDVATKTVNRVFAMIPSMMVGDDEFARARMQFFLEQMNLPMQYSICAKIMQIVRAVRRGRYLKDVGSVPFATISVALDHGVVTTIVTEFDDEVDVGVQVKTGDDQPKENDV